uniref:Protein DETOXIFICATION n=1 Tax=Oryza meridionalis TaxID=40149 RepID=A0A0E0C2M2_9ORYZ
MKFFPYSCRVDWTRENLPPTPLATPEPMAAKEKGYTSSTNKIVLFKHCKHLHTGNTTRTGSFRYIRKRPRPPLFHIISTAPIVRLLSRRSRPVPCAAAAMGSSDSQAPLLLPRGSHRKEEEEEYAAAGKVRGCCGGDGEGGWWREATAEAGRLASLAAPMIAVALLQLMMQLISTVMVGHLGEVALAGAAIANSLTNVSGFSVLHFYCCVGVQSPSCVRVSNELGAGNPEAVLVSVTLLALRHFIGIAFSNEEEVINYVTRMVPVLSVSVITDSLQGVLSGVSRGCGWQHLGAYVNLGAFYLVGVPVALFFGFAMHLGGMGFWMGMVAGGATQVTLLSIITAMTNWGKMAEKARDRVFEERIPTQKAYIIFVLNKEQSILENKHLIAAQTSSRVVTIRFGKNIKSI